MDSKQNSMPILKESHRVMAEVIQILHDGQQKSWRKYFKNMFQDIEEGGDKAIKNAQAKLQKKKNAQTWAQTWGYICCGHNRQYRKLVENFSKLIKDFNPQTSEISTKLQEG